MRRLRYWKIFAHIGDSSPSGFVALGNDVYFAAAANTARELWRSNGTVAGTRIAADPTPTSGTAPDTLFAYNGELLFSARRSGPYGLWSYDPATDGVTKIATSPATQYAFAGSQLLFSNGGELWRTDGTLSGTSQVALLSTTDSISQLTSFNGAVYFVLSGRLWRSDGTSAGTAQVSGSSSLVKLLAAGSTLLYVTTTAFTSIYTYTPSSGQFIGISTETNPHELVTVGDRLYFVRGSTPNTNQLWKSDGTSASTRDPHQRVGNDVGSIPPTLLAAVSKWREEQRREEQRREESGSFRITRKFPAFIRVLGVLTGEVNVEIELDPQPGARARVFVILGAGLLRCEYDADTDELRDLTPEARHEKCPPEIKAVIQEFFERVTRE